MNRGPKPQPPVARGGAFKADQRGGTIEVIEPSAMPKMPDWLTAEGQEVWLDDLGRVQQAKLVTERDSTAFGNYCNLQGTIIKAYRLGHIPPATYLVEARRLQELFGIGGAKSRVGIKVEGGGQNPFARNGKRS